MTELVNNPKLGRPILGQPGRVYSLQDAYQEKYGERIAAKNREAEDKRINDEVEKRLADRTRSSARRSPSRCAPSPRRSTCSRPKTDPRPTRSTRQSPSTNGWSPPNRPSARLSAHPARARAAAGGSTWQSSSMKSTRPSPRRSNPVWSTATSRRAPSSRWRKSRFSRKWVGPQIQENFMYKPMKGGAYRKGSSFDIMRRQTRTGLLFGPRYYQVGITEFLEDLEVELAGPRAAFSRDPHRHGAGLAHDVGDPRDRGVPPRAGARR